MRTGLRQKQAIVEQEQTILHFPGGLLGFEDIKDYVIFDYDENIPLKWMQAISDPSISFVVVDPFIVMPDYNIKLEGQHLHGLEVADIDHIYFYVLITIPRDTPSAMTANLQGPIIINAANQFAKQLVLGKSIYHTKHQLFDVSKDQE